MMFNNPAMALCMAKRNREEDDLTVVSEAFCEHAAVSAVAQKQTNWIFRANPKENLHTITDIQNAYG